MSWSLGRVAIGFWVRRHLGVGQYLLYYCLVEGCSTFVSCEGVRGILEAIRSKIDRLYIVPNATSLLNTSLTVGNYQAEGVLLEISVSGDDLVLWVLVKLGRTGSRQ